MRNIWKVMAFVCAAIAVFECKLRVQESSVKADAPNGCTQDEISFAQNLAIDAEQREFGGTTALKGLILDLKFCSGQLAKADFCAQRQANLRDYRGRIEYWAQPTTNTNNWDQFAINYFQTLLKFRSICP